MKFDYSNYLNYLKNLLNHLKKIKKPNKKFFIKAGKYLGFLFLGLCLVFLLMVVYYTWDLPQPEKFTEAFANRVNTKSRLLVREAKNGDRLLTDVALVPVTGLGSAVTVEP